MSVTLHKVEADIKGTSVPYSNTESESGASSKDVSFAVDEVDVTYWDSGLKKTVKFNESVADLLTAFTMGCRRAFAEELHRSKFRIYALPYNYNHDDINDRLRILTSDALLEVILELGRPDIIPRQLHLFKDIDDTSPSKPPAIAPVEASVASVVTRETEASLNCRAAAVYTCAFCRFQSPSNEDVVSAHIFELQHYNLITTYEGRVEALEEKGLSHIHGGNNMLCLCYQCHRQFDSPYNIGINPSTYALEVRDTIRNSYCGKGKFSTLVGKKVVFAKAWHPPAALLQYRYTFFENGGKKTAGKKRGVQVSRAMCAKKKNLPVVKAPKVEVAPSGM